MFLLEYFSNEVLEMILHHLNRVELVKCTEISSRFNNMISASSRLMGPIVIYWTSAKDSFKVPEKLRKYRCVKFSNSKYSLPMKIFFETFGSSLVWLRIENCTFKMSDLHSAFCMVASTIQEIAFVNPTVEEQKAFPKIQMPRLRYLEFSRTTHNGSDVRFLIRMVATCSLKIISIDEYRDDLVFASSEDTKALVNFLAPQKNLKELTLPRKVANAAMKHWAFETPFEAQLQSLFLHMPTSPVEGFNQTDFSNFWKFLVSQNESLKKLMFTSVQLVGEQLQDLLALNLEELTVIYSSLEWNGKRMTRNSTITRLLIVFKFYEVDDASVDAISHMLTSCEAVTHIMVSFENYDHRIQPVLDKIAKNPKIVDMSVHNITCLNGTTFPFVKNIWAINNNAEDVLKLATSNPQLETLILYPSLGQNTIFRQQLQSLLPTTDIIH